MTTSHTPGPWFASDDEVKYMAKGENGMEFATTIADCGGYEDSEANARLIAAAPETAAERDKLKAQRDELLEPLEALYAIQTPEICPDFTAHKVLNAIANAKGE